jgi:NADH-quinone oxidoreductase subunit N
MNYLHLFQLLAPETILLVTALVVMSLGLGACQSRRTLLLIVTLAGGFFSAALLMASAESANLLNGALLLDPLTRLFKLVIIVLSLVTAVFAHNSRIREHFAEYLALILFSTIGMMLLAGTEELLTVFIALELTSLSLYILTGFQKRDRASAEAALKYFLIGGISAAFLLFGLSLIYGVTGSTNLEVIAKAIHPGALDPLLAAGIVMALVGFGFKVAAVPFHLWAPDVYQGAPVASAALVASGSKVAGFFVLAKILSVGFVGATGSAEWGHFQAGWMPLLAILAALSIVLGNLGALAQTSVKRLLAYSAIAHSGYMLLGLSALGSANILPVLFYVIIYSLTTVGAFGILSVVEQNRGGTHLHHFEGLYKSAPGLSLCMAVFMISLAGIPPLAGFFGKFYLFAGCLTAISHSSNPGMLWLVIVALALNTISLYYYLIVLKRIFVVEPGLEIAALTQSKGSLLLIGVLALSVVVLGICPGLLLDPLRAALPALR